MLSFDEIKQIFEGKKYSDVIRSIGQESIISFVKRLREDLILCGRTCSVFKHLIEQLDDGSEKYSGAALSEFDRRWLELIRNHRGVYEQLGFAFLLKMDAEVMLIEMLSAKSDTERLVTSKHAYTIVAEARNNDLFNELAGRMKSYPEILLPEKEYNALWKTNKQLIKKMTSDEQSNRIRKAIDAHKAPFLKQANEYLSIDWKQSLLDMLIIVQVVDNIGACMDIVHDRLTVAYDAFDKDTREYVAQLDVLIKEVSDRIVDES